MATAPPILIWSPEGGIPVGPVSNPPVYSQAGTTPLIEGQAYVDVVFGSVQTTDEWVLVECVLVNEIDVDPLNIWPGIITDKTAAGFRLQLNGMPDSGNYYLHWAVSGVNITPTSATTYILSGPASGGVGVPSTFTVHLPASTTATATVTPNDSGGGGTFSPTSVTLTTGTPSTTFTYTPGSAGTKTISVTNTGGLLNPADLSFLAINYATGYSLSGPTGGSPSAASTNFTVTLMPSGGAVTGTVTVTPSDSGGGGTFTPTTVGLTTGVPSATFTYTPSATLGARTISTTNNGALTNPAPLTYTVAVGPLSNGDPVGTWLDSSVNVNNATQSGAARPTYKTNIVNSKPVVRFVSANSQGLNLTNPISSGQPWTAFVVMKQAISTSKLVSLGGTFVYASLEHTDGNIYIHDKIGYGAAVNPALATFKVLTSTADPTNKIWYSNGTFIGGGNTADAQTDNFTQIGYVGSQFSDGDIAEIIVYNVVLGSTDRANIEKYLGTKYAITVAGGSAVQPDTVTGLQGWWKADAL